MSENTIELKNVRSLSGMRFFIPDYQRGYRWAAAEAERMLNDFKEFCKRKKDEGEFYCLQPIVVKKKLWTEDVDGNATVVDGYEVIDGQQRLTTLYILLKCVEPARKILHRKFEMYSIKYETRLEFDSQKFLESIDCPNDSADNFIDFHYMKTVYDAMAAWMDKNDDFQNDIIDALLKQKVDDATGIDKANNIRVIWYEVSDDETATSVDIFTRLNIGKIPLTNAELIKALLLRRGNFPASEASMKQLQISAEWNEMEQKLQDDSFWYFLCRTSWPFKYDNRIEFIFDLMKGRTPDAEFYFTFNEFNRQLELLAPQSEHAERQAAIERVWQEVKNVFQTFEEWYDDRVLYHYIGFLIEYGVNINELMHQSLTRSKSDFLDNYIKGEKLKGLMGDVALGDLSYGDKNVKKVLLLFNILTVLKSAKSEMRFPFDRYKKENWDIEHICSQTDKDILNDSRREEWINDMLEFFTGTCDEAGADAVIANLKAAAKKSDGGVNTVELKLIKRIRALRDSGKDGKINEAEFKDVFAAVQKHFAEDKIENKDSICNLALLDAQTNRAYGNAFFPIKRKWIISNDSRGIFVPIATKNVFLKYYSRKGNDLMMWGKQDADDYLEAIKQTLGQYVKQE